MRVERECCNTVLQRVEARVCPSPHELGSPVWVQCVFPRRDGFEACDMNRERKVILLNGSYTAIMNFKRPQLLGTSFTEAHFKPKQNIPTPLASWRGSVEGGGLF